MAGSGRVHGLRSMKHQQSNGFRLAAIDLDGTLLGPDVTISAANVEAINTLQAMGTEVVLASGRHHHSMRSFADLLPEIRWLVSVQGGEVSDVSRKTVLQRSFLRPSDVGMVLELSETLGFSTVIYTPEAIFTTRD